MVFDANTCQNPQKSLQQCHITKENEAKGDTMKDLYK